MACAALLIATVVEREQDLGDELAALVEHRVDHIGRGVLKAWQIGVAGQADDMIEDEARVAHGGCILGHVGS